MFDKELLMINLILFGPPGSGKGTQATMLAEKYNLVHVSTGDLFRSEIGNKTELGLKAKAYMDKGNLVPDEVTIGMLENKVNANKNAAGFIFDGFPRTIPQCESLDQFLRTKGQDVTALISLSVDDEELVKRLLHRGKDSGRPDDLNETVIRKRISVYEEETAPVYTFYKAQGIANTIPGEGAIEEIFASLTNLMDSLV